MNSIRLELTTSYGTYISEIMTVTDEQLHNLQEKSKKFYEEGGFEMYTDDGFIIISPEILKKSILKIKIENEYKK